MASLIDMAQHTAAQSGRFAWYLGHRMIGSRLSMTDVPAAGGTGPAFAEPRRPAPPLSVLIGDVVALFGRDARNVQAGLYPVPDDQDGDFVERLRASRAFFSDLRPAQQRRAANRRRDVATLPDTSGLPDYYLHNFHFQEGGYLTARSAELYDTQVEVLFLGAGNAMRRQALVPLNELFRERDQRGATLVDLGCGTGRFLGQVRQAFPALSLIGVDLSKPYLDRARMAVKPSRGTAFLNAPAERTPLAAGTADAVTAVFLLHEVPGAVRRSIAEEAVRLLKPGGILVVVDSLQDGDRPGWDGLLDAFERGFHEPYYRSYIEDDLVAAFGDAGLGFERSWSAFLSKIMVFRKP